jgi:hypothetical protein
LIPAAQRKIITYNLLKMIMNAITSNMYKIFCDNRPCCGCDNSICYDSHFRIYDGEDLSHNRESLEAYFKDDCDIPAIFFSDSSIQWDLLIQEINLLMAEPSAEDANPSSNEVVMLECCDDPM